MSFKSVMGGILQGAGSVLSFIPGVGPLLGTSIIAAGQNLSAKAKGADVVASAAATLAAQQKAAIAANNAAANSLATTSIFDWIQKNMLIVAIAIGAVFILIVKPFKRRR